MPLLPDQRKLLARIGANIKAVRSRAKITQQKLADGAELDIRTVQKIEAGELNILITTLTRLKAALNCRWDDLLGK